MRTRANLKIGAIISLFLQVLWLGFCAAPCQAANTGTSFGQAAPDFTLPDITGGWIKLSDLL